MSLMDVLQTATSGLTGVPEEWMPATGTRAFVLDAQRSGHDGSSLAVRNSKIEV